MTKCRHCEKEIRYKNRVWVEVIPKDSRIKYRRWYGTGLDELSASCIRSISGGPEISFHEPTKEDKIRRLLKGI